MPVEKHQEKTENSYQEFFCTPNKINFNHPRTGDRIGFESPLPAELENVLKYFRITLFKFAIFCII